MRRTRGWRKPARAVYVGRPTEWGNPWRVGGKAHGALDAATAQAHYRDALLRAQLRGKDGRPLVDRLQELRGKDLACWCAPGQPCHADVLLHFANSTDFQPPV